MFKYLEKIKRYKIWEKSFNYVISNNNSFNLTYHNNKHIIYVFDIATDIAENMGLNENEIVEIGIACLFHDINHSGKLTDKENLNIAIKEFNKFINLNPYDFSIYSTTNIIEMIMCTEFPKKKEPTTIQEKIVMDSDLLQAFDSDWFLSTVVGLSKEHNVSINKALQNQIIFINNVSYYTDYVNNIYSNNKNDHIIYLEYLKTVFK